MTLHERIYYWTEDHEYYRVNNIMNLDSIDCVCPICKKDWQDFELRRKYFNEDDTKNDKYYILCCKDCIPQAITEIMKNTSEIQYDNLMRIIVEKI